MVGRELATLDALNSHRNLLNGLSGMTDNSQRDLAAQVLPMRSIEEGGALLDR